MARACHRRLHEAFPLTCCALAVALALAACKPRRRRPADRRARPRPARGRPPTPSLPRSTPPISPSTCKTLASDEFEGRAPGSAGEEKTVAYLEAQFQRLGLKPGNGDSYFQTVPMVETTADESAGAQARRRRQAARAEVRHRHGDRHAHRQAEVKVDDSELVFVGYGVNAPGAEVERLRRRRREGQDGGDVRQRPRLPQPAIRRCSKASG